VTACRAAAIERTDAKMLDAYVAAAGGFNRSLFAGQMQSEAYLPLSVAKCWGLIGCLVGEARWHAGRPYTF
jgi:hypothetical protein